MPPYAERWQLLELVLRIVAHLRVLRRYHNLPYYAVSLRYRPATYAVDVYLPEGAALRIIEIINVRLDDVVPATAKITTLT